MVNQIALKSAASVACAVPGATNDGEGGLGQVSNRIRPEITADGGFRRQGNVLPRRFGYEIGQIPVIPNRYRVIGLIGCGWNRRQRIVLRLLGLDRVVAIESVIGKKDRGWILNPEGLGKEFGYTYLADFYEATVPGFTGRATSPAVIDEATGKVVTNDYQTLSLDWETEWKPYHKPDAPDLYPDFLRPQIDLLSQQLFDDINNGTYKIIFATERDVAEVALTVFEARLGEIDQRLRTRRYLFGRYLTDSDVRLFQTLAAYEVTYRPGIIRKVGHEVRHLWDFPHLWDYARDLFATPGFIDDEELHALGYLPFEDGTYAYAFGYTTTADTAHENGPADRREYLERWREPVDRTGLDGSWEYTGPGTGGLDVLWSFGEYHPENRRKEPSRS